MSEPIARGYVEVLPDKAAFDAGVGKLGDGDAGDKIGRSIGSKIGGGLASTFKTVAVGATAGLAIGGALASSAIGAAQESAKIAAQTDAVIKSTGGAANATAKQIGELAASLSNKSGVDDEAIQSGQNLLLTFTELQNRAGDGNDIFNQASGVMVDMAAAMGTDVKSGAIQLGKALNDPIKGVSALSEVGVTFTEQQREQIKAMQEAGDMAGAQKIILGELNKEFGGSAAAQATSADRMKVAFGNLQEQIGAKLIPVVEKLSKFATEKLLPALSSLAERVAPKVSAAFTAIGKAIGDFWERRGPAITAFISGTLVPALQTLGEKFVQLGQWVATNVFPVLVAFAGWLAEHVPPVLATIAEFVTTKVIPALQSLGEWAQDKLLPALQKLWASFKENILPVLQELATFVVEKVLPVLASIGEWIIKNVLPVVGKLVTFILEKFIPALFEIVGFIDEKVVPKIKEFGEKVGEVVSDIKGFASDVLTKFGEVVTFFKDLPGKIKEFFVGLAGTIKAPFVEAFEAIAHLWNTTVGALSFEVPDWVPVIGGKGWDVPNIGSYDKGGLVPGAIGAPQLAIVHGGEYVIPVGGSAPASAGGNTIIINAQNKRSAYDIKSELSWYYFTQRGRV